jgi:putative ABC transport system permease protein
MFLNGTLKITIRNFKKNITTTLIKIFGLVISITTVVIIWSYIINENKYDSNIPDSDRIFRLDAQWASLPPYLGHVLNQNINTQIISTRLNFWEDIGIQVNNNPSNLKELVFADSSFFKVFKFGFLEGDPKEALNKPFGLVLSVSVAKRLFGNSDPLGRIVRFQNQYDFTVTGIIDDRPYMHFKTEVIASIVSLEQIRYKGVLKEYDGWNYPTYVLLPESVPISKSEKTLLDLLSYVGYKEHFTLKPFPKIYYSPEVENESNTKHGNKLYNKILLSVSIFILLLAAINFINLTIADALARSKEISMRKLQGSARFQLIVQFLFETILYIFISIGLSFFLIWFFTPLIDSLTGFSINLSDITIQRNLLILISGIIIFIISTGIYPGIYISSYNINRKALPESASANHIGIRNGLVIFQNMVSIGLICCTLIANKQFLFIKKKDLGFNKSGVVNLTLNSQLSAKMDLFKDRLLKNPEIVSVSYSSRIPGNYWGSWCCVNIEGKENKYFNNYVDPDYLKTLGIKIKTGRNFSVENKAETRATYLINETAVRIYNLKNPIGQLITPGNGIKGEIIGIIYDFHYRGLIYPQTPLLLFNTPDYKRYVNIRVNQNSTSGALGKIEDVWKEICPAFEFEYSFLDETYDLQYKSERRFENLMLSFSLLAVFIASIGLFGLSIYSTTRRTKEIGIRKVNGGKTGEIMIMLNKDFIKWVVVSFFLAVPLAWYAMNKWLQSFAYRTDIGWEVFVIAGIIAFGIAITTVSLQSWRAAIKNPVEALRYE